MIACARGGRRNLCFCMIQNTLRDTCAASLVSELAHVLGAYTAWLLLVPGVLMVVAFIIWLHLVSFGAQLDAAVPMIALFVSAGFAVWACIAGGQAEANRFGASVTAG